MVRVSALPKLSSAYVMGLLSNNAVKEGEGGKLTARYMSSGFTGNEVR